MRTWGTYGSWPSIDLVRLRSRSHSDWCVVTLATSCRLSVYLIRDISVQRKSLFQFNGVVGTKTDVAEDLDAGLLWKFYGADASEEGMYA